MKPVPSAEFTKVFGTHKVPSTRTAADALCSDLTARMQAARTASFYTAEQREQAVTRYTYFLQVARAHRAQLFGVK